VPDICDLILEQHHEFRLRFAELDGLRDADGDTLAGVWKPLADLLEVHATAEEELFYPRLLDLGDEPVEETEDAITDHNDITEAVERSKGLDPGSDEWWDAVDAAREENSEHTAEEERGALADFRRNASQELRDEIGAAWLAFHGEHGDEHDRDEKDLVDYVDEHGDDDQVEAAKEMAQD
jgi:hypothetical protein